MASKGIELSDFYSTIPISWKSISESEYGQFVMLRLGNGPVDYSPRAQGQNESDEDYEAFLESEYVPRIVSDTTFEEYLRCAHDYNIPVGVWYDSYATTDMLAKVEARWIRTQLNQIIRIGGSELKYCSVVSLPVFIRFSPDYGTILGTQLGGAVPEPENLDTLPEVFVNIVKALFDEISKDKAATDNSPAEIGITNTGIYSDFLSVGTVSSEESEDEDDEDEDLPSGQDLPVVTSDYVYDMSYSYEISGGRLISVNHYIDLSDGTISQINLYLDRISPIQPDIKCAAWKHTNNVYISGIPARFNGCILYDEAIAVLAEGWHLMKSPEGVDIWKYVEDGAYVINRWMKIPDNTGEVRYYYFGSSGAMLTNATLEWNGIIYVLRDDGVAEAVHRYRSSDEEVEEDASVPPPYDFVNQFPEVRYNTLQNLKDHYRDVSSDSPEEHPYYLCIRSLVAQNKLEDMGIVKNSADINKTWIGLGDDTVRLMYHLNGLGYI